MALIVTAGASAAGNTPVLLRTREVRLVFAVSLLLLRAVVPLPRTVMVRFTVWLVSDVTDGRVQVGVARVGSSSVPPFTLQSYSTAPS